jgi:hypothetical protein
MSRGSAGLIWLIGLSDNIYNKKWFLFNLKKDLIKEKSSLI